MNKKYCENCFFFYINNHNGYLPATTRCQHKNNLIIGNWQTSKYEKYDKHPSELNKNNDCQLYSPKIK